MNYIHREYSYGYTEHIGLTSYEISPTVEELLECDFTGLIEHCNCIIRHTQEAQRETYLRPC